ADLQGRRPLECLRAPRQRPRDHPHAEWRADRGRKRWPLPRGQDRSAIQRRPDQVQEGAHSRAVEMKAALAWVLLLASLSAAGEDFPSKPVRILIGFTPGGGPDLTARQLAP